MKKKQKIIFYDFADINYSSFFLTGILENQNTYNYKFIVSKRVPSMLGEPTMNGEWKKLLFSICLFKAELAEEEFYFCIDTRDSCDTNKEGAGYHLPILEKVKYYFKVNYNDDAIKNDAELRRYSNKIISVLPFFPIRMPRLLAFLPRIIPSKVASWTARDITERIKGLRNLLSLEEIRRFRNVKKNIDLFFVTNYYYFKESYSPYVDFRYQIMKEIRKHRNIVSITGFATDAKPAEKHAEFHSPRYDLRNYLNSIAKAKVAIYVRGLHNCLSFKFGQLLAMGMPIVGQTILNNQEEIYSNEYFPEQFAFDNPKEIVDKAIELLSNSEKLEKLSYANAQTFDSKFTPQAVTAVILERLAK